jgi:hypothetical protein
LRQVRLDMKVHKQHSNMPEECMLHWWNGDCWCQFFIAKIKLGSRIDHLWWKSLPTSSVGCCKEFNISLCPEEYGPEMIKTSTSDAAWGTLMFTIQTLIVFAKNLSIAETIPTSYNAIRLNPNFPPLKITYKQKTSHTSSSSLMEIHLTKEQHTNCQKTSPH